MNPPADCGAAVERFVGNPFSTRHTSPGRIESLDRDGNPLEPGRLLDDLAGLGGRAAIRGRHGSGKTTLLLRLADAAERRGERVVRLRVHSPWDLAIILRAFLGGRSGSLVCIDSWEKLGGPAAALTQLLAGLWGIRIIVTTHGGCGLPTLAACETSPALLAAIVRRLPARDAWADVVIGDDDVAAAFERASGDVREALFMLYDLFEDRSRSRSGTG